MSGNVFFVNLDDTISLKFHCTEFGIQFNGILCCQRNQTYRPFSSSLLRLLFIGHNIDCNKTVTNINLGNLLLTSRATCLTSARGLTPLFSLIPNSQQIIFTFDKYLSIYNV